MNRNNMSVPMKVTHRREAPSAFSKAALRGASIQSRTELMFKTGDWDDLSKRHFTALAEKWEKAKFFAPASKLLLSPESIQVISSCINEDKYPLFYVLQHATSDRMADHALDFLFAERGSILSQMKSLDCLPRKVQFLSRELHIPVKT
jgi:hypothetical protein